jgi:hypothetical protein
MAKAKDLTSAQMKIALAKKETEVSALQDKALTLWKKEKSQAQELGEVLNKLKPLMDHGTFHPWLDENKIDRNHASYCMRLANGKHAASRKRNGGKQSQRGQLFSKVRASLRDMYAFSQKREAGKAQQMYNEIKRLLDSLMREAMSPPKKRVRSTKSKTKGAAA